MAEELATKVRIYGFILTTPATKQMKAVHVKATWASRFDKFVFISSEDDPSFPTLKAVEFESRKHLWLKTRFGVINAYRNHLNDFDFFMKADDDTYVIVENLRLLLSTKDPDLPMLLGRRFQKYVAQGYASGGAGYVLSRAGLKAIAEGMLRNATGCEPSLKSEDYLMGLCAQKVGVKLIDTLDEYGRETFHPFRPVTMVNENWLRRVKWFPRFNAHPIVSGVNCCSDHSISFHYMRPADMYMVENLVYHLYPYGIARDLETYRNAMENRSRRGGTS
ncbi:unnamed protein product [Schistocephalus solidus]|uniref:N-acetylgalactosaminide beta-1,3-galactosyltransferase n=1 Tax=Schistocephalus solidus TaxID=70667 RepID=A0A3P7DY46_SCHSO|nr:unnamed protein product [Schistocephalus solidus]